MAQALSLLIPANYSEILLLTNPLTLSFEISSVVYSRAAVLAHFNSVSDSSGNNGVIGSLSAIKNAPVNQVSKPSLVK